MKKLTPIVMTLILAGVNAGANTSQPVLPRTASIWQLRNVIEFVSQDKDITGYSTVDAVYIAGREEDGSITYIAEIKPYGAKCYAKRYSYVRKVTRPGDPNRGFPPRIEESVQAYSGPELPAPACKTAL